MKLLNSKSNRGSILIELIVGLFIGSIIIIVFIQILDIASKVYENTNDEDDIFFSSDYLLSYLEKEINKADEIYLLSDAKYNILFYRSLENVGVRNNNYYTYVIKNNEIRRMAENKERKLRYDELYNINLEGNNELANKVKGLNLIAYKNYILVELNIGNENKNRNLRKNIYFNCRVIDLRSR